MSYSNRKNPQECARALPVGAATGYLWALALVFCLTLAPALHGCGYGLSYDTPSVIGDSTATLRLTGVEQPTLYPWVVHTVHSALRDEINARNLAVWVDGGQADYNMHVKVNFFTMRGAVLSRVDQPLMYDGSVSLTATVYRASDNTQIWRNTVAYTHNFDSGTEEDAGRSLFAQAIRRLAESMRSTF